MGTRVAAVVLMAALAGCSAGGGAPTIKLDGSAHPPTDAGVVTSADRHAVVLDGKRRYTVNPNLVVFIPGSLQLAPLAGTVGRYALIGATGHRVDWVEPLSVVVDQPGLPATVFYFGTLVRAGTTATFGDGTVLPLAPGVGLAGSVSLPHPVRADIDPATHLVRTLAPQ